MLMHGTRASGGSSYNIISREIVNDCTSGVSASALVLSLRHEHIYTKMSKFKYEGKTKL
jgi:hypothetical protein